MKLQSGKIGRRLWVVFSLMFLAGGSLALDPPRVVSQGAAATVKRVLVLHHYGRESPAVALFDQGFEEEMRSAPSGSLEFYWEALQSYRFPGEDHAQLMRNYLKQKYSDRKPDVIVAFADTSLDFMLKYRDELFPGVPIVYLVSRRREPGPPLSTGVWTGLNMKDTVEVALQLQPATERVFVISGPLNDNQSVEAEAQNQLHEFESRLRITYLINRPLEEVLTTVKTLPEHSIVLCQRQTRGFDGKGIVARDAVAMITDAANVPVYSTFDVWMGYGIVGGKVVSHLEMGHQVARSVLRIAHGENPQVIPPETARLIPMFDWRQLRRWGIGESTLPAGSVVLFRQITFWEQYRWRIVGVIGVCIIEALLIIGLLIQRSRRATAEESRRLSEEKFSKAFRSSPDAFVMTRRADGTILEVNERWQDLLGYAREEAIGRTTIDLDIYVSSTDRQRFMDEIAKQEFVRDFEADIRTKNGEIKRTVLSAETVIINNEPCALVIIRDVTGQRESERALQKMTGKLITLRDEEQRRIAAELHDGLGQSLVIINNRALIGLRDADKSSRSTEQFEEISFAASSAIDEVREIVYNLRPHELGKLGLVHAIKSMVTKISDTSSLQLVTDLDEIDGLLSEEAETNIYRIVQEALNNVVKHAEATEARVALKRAGTDLVVTVEDNGKGIVRSRNGDRNGFGLVGIAERARLLGGALQLSSTPGNGAHLSLTVSLNGGQWQKN